MESDHKTIICYKAQWQSFFCFLITVIHSWGQTLPPHFFPTRNLPLTHPLLSPLTSVSEQNQIPTKTFPHCPQPWMIEGTNSEQIRAALLPWPQPSITTPLLTHLLQVPLNPLRWVSTWSGSLSSSHWSVWPPALCLLQGRRDDLYRPPSVVTISVAGTLEEKLGTDWSSI